MGGGRRKEGRSIPSKFGLQVELLRLHGVSQGDAIVVYEIDLPA